MVTLLVCALFFVSGVIWYNLDLSLGARVCRWWVNMTRRDPVAGYDKGFIYHRSARAKGTVAVVLSTAQSLLAFRYIEHDLTTEFVMWLVEIPLMIAGFYAARAVTRAWRARKNVFDTIDRVESGEVDVSEKVGALAGSLRGRAGSMLSLPAFPNLFGRRKVVVQTVPTPPAAPIEPDRSSEELMNSYIKKSR